MHDRYRGRPPGMRGGSTATVKDFEELSTFEIVCFVHFFAARLRQAGVQWDHSATNGLKSTPKNNINCIYIHIYLSTAQQNRTTRAILWPMNRSGIHNNMCIEQISQYTLHR